MTIRVRSTIPGSLIRYVIYARYSSSRQSTASIEDQKRMCRDFEGPREWQEIRTYEDPKLPGGSIDRRGIQKLMQDSASPTRDFDVILIDSTSRLSRGLRDVFDLHGDFQIFGVWLSPSRKASIPTMNRPKSL